MGPVKLNDVQMQQYIRDGYVMLETGLPPEFHQALFRKTDEVFKSEGNPGNNLLPRLPDVGKVLGDPVVAGALAGTGPRAEQAVSELTAALEDNDRYVRGNSVHALSRIDSSDARDSLIDYLMASRWCHSTTKDSAY